MRIVAIILTSLILTACSSWTPFVAGDQLVLEVPESLLTPPSTLITIEGQIPLANDISNGL